MSTRRKLQRQHKLANPPRSLPQVSGRAFGASPGLLGSTGQYEDACPVCHGEVSEVGGLGCCGAITAHCVGTVDGEPVPPEGFDEGDPREDQVVHHFWYTDTGERAPSEFEDDGISCRCG